MPISVLVNFVNFQYDDIRGHKAVPNTMLSVAEESGRLRNVFDKQ